MVDSFVSPLPRFNLSLSPRLLINLSLFSPKFHHKRSPPTFHCRQQYSSVIRSEQNCIGAIDGTHISAHVPVEKQVSYRGRKSMVTQNVLCACNFDMMFTFVYATWEGTANDSRVFIDAISRPENNFPVPKEDEYYVVDSGFPCTKGFLPPYLGQKYHLNEFRGRSNQPRGYKELFNYRHSSLRNVIERCFGVLKARFPILKMMPPYKLHRQPLIVIAVVPFIILFVSELSMIPYSENGKRKSLRVMDKIKLVRATQIT